MMGLQVQNILLTLSSKQDSESAADQGKSIHEAIGFKNGGPNMIRNTGMFANDEDKKVAEYIRKQFEHWYRNVPNY